MDKATGPMPPEEFKALADAPYGEAIKALRKYDPLIGREPGAKIKWRATLSQKQWMQARVTVEAVTEIEAAKLIGGMDAGSFNWEYADSDSDDDFEIDEIKPL